MAACPRRIFRTRGDDARIDLWNVKYLIGWTAEWLREQMPEPAAWAPVLAVLLPSCVVLGKFLPILCPTLHFCTMTIIRATFLPRLQI